MTRSQILTGISSNAPQLYTRGYEAIEAEITSLSNRTVDTVAHCGNSLAGDFIWSLTMTDLQTTWTENRATWNKGAAGVLDQIKDIENKLPFAMKGFDCDNCSEFLYISLTSIFHWPLAQHLVHANPALQEK